MTHHTLLLQIVKRWNLESQPEYRRFRCANCQQYMQGKVWHHFLQDNEFVCPIHFCDDCEQKFENLQISVNKPEVSIDRTSFGNNYTYTHHAIKIFRDIFTHWQQTPHIKIKKQFSCDLCGHTLEADSEGYATGFHAWWNNHGVLIEFHFDKTCGTTVGFTAES